MSLALVAGASNEKSGAEIAVVSGTAEVQSAGKWHPSSTVPADMWVRAKDLPLVLQAEGARLRLEPGTRARLSRTKQGRLLSVRDGSFYLRCDSACQTDLGNGILDVGEGEVIADSKGDPRVLSAQGNVRWAQAPEANRQVFKAYWSKSGSLIAGSDVRKRGRKNRKKFTLGQENKGRLVGEDTRPTASTPDPTGTPAPVEPGVVPPPVAFLPVVPVVAAVAAAGSSVLPIALGAAVLGGTGALVANSGGTDAQQIVAPASP